MIPLLTGGDPSEAVQVAPIGHGGADGCVESHWSLRNEGMEETISLIFSSRRKKACPWPLDPTVGRESPATSANHPGIFLVAWGGFLNKGFPL